MITAEEVLKDLRNADQLTGELGREKIMEYYLMAALVKALLLIAETLDASL